MKILFLHGSQAIPGGVKPTYLRDHGHTVINPALPDDDFAATLAIAQAEYDKHHPDVVVGSSRGGALAMNLHAGDTPLVLLCPAWKKYGTAKTIKENDTILHSRADDVVPYADSEELVRSSGLPAYTLIETGNDHRLADPESLEIMLEACERTRLAPGISFYRNDGDASKDEGLMAYHIESNSWSHLKPKGSAPPPANTNAAFYEYDARLDKVVAIHFKGTSPGIFVYDPNTNAWADPIPFPADGPTFQYAANTCFNRELNAYFCHVAGDSDDNGVMWVYRYKKQKSF